jgi:hypothetical protein
MATSVVGLRAGEPGCRVQVISPVQRSGFASGGLGCLGGEAAMLSGRGGPFGGSSGWCRSFGGPFGGSSFGSRSVLILQLIGGGQRGGGRLQGVEAAWDLIGGEHVAI